MEYLTKKQTKKNRQEFYKIYHSLKSNLGSKWSMNYSLVGSAKRNLVLVGNEGYDLDFHIYIYNSPITDEEEMKNTFKESLDEIVPRFQLKPCEDSTHVLTIKKIIDGTLVYAYDIALMRKNSEGEYLILKNEKLNQGNGPYHFVQVPKANDFIDRYKQIDNSEKWAKLRNKYKFKKEQQQNICKDNRVHSFSLLLESINEVIN